MNESLISGLILAGLKIKKIPSFESVIEVLIKNGITYC